MRRLTVSLALLVLANAGTALAQSGDAPPTRPDGFRATLYDKAGGELFWQRSTDDRGAVRGYEITRNGQSLGIRDALSFYDRSLEPNTPYTFTVVAIDNAGQRSAPATTTLGGGTATPPASGAPAAPAALRSDVYSRRSAELFWRREPAALALRYEIRRDGRVVGTTNGVSYFTRDLAAGTDYVFEVVAIDRQGRRSEASRVTLRTDGSSPTASGPPAPAELRVDVYSRRSAELFWRRESAALALRYEVRRDGAVVGTTNGVSYFTRDLAAGRGYAFEVVAIDRDGRRSSASRITVHTDGERPTSPTADAPAAPAGLRAERYSAGAGELFWRREPAALRLRYEVRRDGRVLATTDGTSYFDDTLSAGRAYAYEVVAIDPAGRRSAPARLTFGGTGNGGGPDAPIPQPVQASLEPVADKTFRFSWTPSAGAEFYRVLENADGVSGFTRSSGDLAASTRTLDLRVPLYERVNARYIVQACNARGCADSEELAVSGALESAVGYFKASNAEGGPERRIDSEGDAFGFAVSLSADGDTLAIGADGEDSAATGTNGDQSDNSDVDSGAVYVFARIDGRWRQQAYLKPTILGTSDRLEERFGRALDLSDDGDTLAVGAPACCGTSGRFYVFARRDGVWRTTAALAVLDAEPGVGVGAAVSLSGDGDTLAVGSSIRNSGTVYVYTDRNGFWRLEAELTATGIPFSGSVTNAVTLGLSADGDTLAIGTPWEGGAATGVDGDQDDQVGNESGAVFVYARTDGTWRQQAYVKASNTGNVDSFGRAVALSADGGTLAVGAVGEDSAATGIDGDQEADSVETSSSGAVYVFVRGGGSWRQEAYVKASNTGEVDLFGGALALSANGDTLAVGADLEASAATGIGGDENDDSAERSGAVYVFARTGGTWRQRAYVKAPNADAGDFFGEAVALSADGGTLAVGAPEESGGATGIGGDQEDDSAPGAGAVYLY